MPVAVTGISAAKQVSAGDDHACAVLQDGTAKCWGYGLFGRLGDNTQTERTTPVAVSNLTSVAQISAGFQHSCAVKTTGEAYCWGYNGNAQLGDGTTTQRLIPTLITGISSVKQISAGNLHSCAIKTNYRVYCWGFNNLSQLGDNSTTQRTSPVLVQGLPDCYSDSDTDATPDCIDGCPNDPNKIAAGICGCGTADTNQDGDGQADCNETCDNDPLKLAPGQCGCGNLDTDSDGDGTANCNDNCPSDPNKVAPGLCGCGTADTNQDGDSQPDCNETCDNDPNKLAPGVCGCGTPDSNADGDSELDCNETCDNDPNKLAPGVCGCGIADGNADGDSQLDCNETCDDDPAKLAPGACGCGFADTDGDNDGTANCVDGCPGDPLKTAVGFCGCDNAETDEDTDGFPNCVDTCIGDHLKGSPGQCGCGIPDTDGDGDGTANCNDACPDDVNKVMPGVCDCGTSDEDNDGDTLPDCNDGCPSDPLKMAIGTCGCGFPDTDSDLDSFPNCIDNCPDHPIKQDPGVCGCDVPDTDSDLDTTPDCIDLCPDNPGKTAPGVCGCLLSEDDSDNDGTKDCDDLCPYDPDKLDPGECGCADTAEPTTTTCTTGFCAAADHCDGAGHCGELSDCFTGDGDIVTAGYGHSCAALPNGQVWCWGRNTYGRLGDGTETQRLSPVRSGTIDSATWVSGRGFDDLDFTCALSDGHVNCYGWGAEGQMGNGTTTTTNKNPVQVSGITDAVQLTVGDANACVVKEDHTIKCWGQNAWGNLGDNSTTNRSNPVSVSGISNAVQVSCGDMHCCAALLDGGIKCWGNRDFGKLGDGGNTYGNQTTPVSVAGLGGTALQVSAGYGHTCARLSGGTVKCWGYNALGQLGDGTYTQRTSPTAVNLGGVAATQVSAGYIHTCAVLSTGALKCWGNDDFGKLGNNDSGGNFPSPTQVTGLTSGVVQVSAGFWTTCAAKSDGTIKCWGHNVYGEIGDGTTGDKDVPTNVSGLPNCTLDSDSDTVPDCSDGCPGDPLKTAVGACGCGTPDTNTDGDAVPNCHETCDDDPLKTAPGICGCGISDTADHDTDSTPDCLDDCDDDPTKIAAGACGCNVPDTDGDGDGTADCIDECPLDDTRTLAGDCGCPSNPEHVGVACSDGACTANTECDGLGTCGAFDECTVVEGAGVEVDFFHTCAAYPNGEVYCWGYGLFGRLGNGTQTTSHVPVKVSGISDAVQVSNHGDDDLAFSCAVLKSGKVKCWGYGALGGMGNGHLNVNNLAPVEVSDLTDAVQVSVGNSHACALRKTGVVSCWGLNTLGVLGDGTLTWRLKSVPVPSLVASQVSAGALHTCAIRKSDHKVVCWGFRASGRLGNGGNAYGYETSPVLVSGITNASQVSAGWAHTCAIDGGQLKCWGWNSNGQLGTGDYAQHTTPITVTGVANAVQVSAGFLHTCAVNAAGTAFCWGFRGNGRIGNGEPVWGNTKTPVQVSNITDVAQISAGFFTTCAVTHEEKIYCWGWNVFGMVGDDSTAERHEPVQVSDCTLDSDGDGSTDCADRCVDDPHKVVPGSCGCGVSDQDTDSDGLLNCNEACPFDPDKTTPGTCGCGMSDTDEDEDGFLDCEEECVSNADKQEPGECGCFEDDADIDGDGVADCVDPDPTGPQSEADCLLYGLNEEPTGSRLFTLNLRRNREANLGPVHIGTDLDGLAVHPTTGQLYAVSSGAGGASGKLYRASAETGDLDLRGETGYSEVSGLTFRNSDATLWLWAQGIGLVQVDPVTGAGTLAYVPATGPLSMSAIAWKADGSSLYSLDSSGSLWEHDLDLAATTLLDAAYPVPARSLHVRSDGLIVTARESWEVSWPGGPPRVALDLYDPGGTSLVTSWEFDGDPDQIKDIAWFDWCGNPSPGGAADLIVNVEIDPLQVCENESVSISVETLHPENPSDEVQVYVDGKAGSAQTLQFGGTPGNRRISIYATTLEGHIDRAERQIEVVACPGTVPPPRIETMASPYEQATAILSIANADDYGQVEYTWDFGDGTAPIVTAFPYTEHSYLLALDRDAPFTVFEVTVSADVAGASDPTASRSMSMWNVYAMFKEEGTIQVPVSGDGTLESTQGGTVGEYTLTNLEGLAVVFSEETVRLSDCNPDGADTEFGPISISDDRSVGAGESRTFELPLPAYFPPNVCSIALEMRGARSDGFPVRASAFFEVQANPQYMQLVTDPGTLSALNTIASLPFGFISNPDDISDQELLRFAGAGLVPFPSKGMSLGPTSNHHTQHVDGVAVQSLALEAENLITDCAHTPRIGGCCRPGDTANNLLCQPSTMEFVAAPSYLANALKGDSVVNTACGMVGTILLAVKPAQKFTHVGIMTKDFYEITDSTASEERMEKDFNNGFLGNPTDGLLEHGLKWAFPGPITQSIDEAIKGTDAYDPVRDKVYSIQSFNFVPTRCKGTERLGGLVDPLVLKPLRDPLHPGRSLAARRVAQKVADRARGYWIDDPNGDGNTEDSHSKGHYRWFAYTRSDIGVEGEAGDESDRNAPDEYPVLNCVPINPGFPVPCIPTLVDEIGYARNTWPSECAAMVWTAYRHEGITLEGKLDLGDKRPKNGVEVDSETPDGLYFYDEAERRAAADALRAKIYNKAYGIAGWFGTFLTDAPDDIANQVLNCFASDACNEDAKDSDAWKEPGVGRAVSPDDMEHWDVYPVHERAKLFAGRNLRVYRWVDDPNITDPGTVLVTVVRGSLLSPVKGADVQLTGASPTACNGGPCIGVSDQNGNVSFTNVEPGLYEVQAQKLIDGHLWIESENDVLLDVVSGMTIPHTVHLKGPEAKFREVTIDGTMFMKDDEFCFLCSSSETGTWPFGETIPVSAGTPVVRTYGGEGQFCVGDEVRTTLVVTFEVANDSGGVSVSWIHRLYEGTDCDTTDKDGTSSIFFTPPVCPGCTSSFDSRVDNGEWDSDDYSIVKATVFNDVQ